MFRNLRTLVRAAVGPMGKVAVATLAVGWGVKMLQDVALELGVQAEESEKRVAQLREEAQVWTDLLEQSTARFAAMNEEIMRADGILTSYEDSLKERGVPYQRTALPETPDTETGFQD